MHWSIATLIIFAVWVVTGLLLVGIGLLVRRSLGLSIADRDTQPLLFAFWLGWATVIGILQIWHLYYPVNHYALVLIVAPGAAGMLWNYSALATWVRRVLGMYPYLLVLLLIVGLWGAYRATGPVTLKDTGLYHIPSVLWAAEYPVIPGLGNLEGRLAFNISVFLYAALFRFRDFLLQPYNFVNGLFLWVLAAQVLASIRALVDGRSSPFHLFLTFLSVRILYQLFSIDYVSLSPEVAILGINIVLAAQMLLFIRNDEPAVRTRYRAVWIATIACAGITSKPSFIVLGTLTVFITLLVWIRKTQSYTLSTITRCTSYLALPSGVLLIPWAIRNAFLSGYLSYPSPLLPLPVDWRMPRSLVLSHELLIGAWARARYAHWSQVLGNSAWFLPWLKDTASFWVPPFLLCIAALGALALARRRGLARSGHRSDWLFLLPQVLSLPPWFYAAPSWRFANGSEWILAAGITALCTDRILRAVHPERDRRFARLQAVVAATLAVTILSYTWLHAYRRQLFIRPHPNGVYPLPAVRYDTRRTNSGLEVHVPRVSRNTLQQKIRPPPCWDTPLPCAPHFYPELRLRKINDLGSGFVLDRTRTYADHSDMELSPFSVPSQIGVFPVWGGWGWFDPVAKTRRLDGQGMLVVYVEEPTIIDLSLVPREVSAGGASAECLCLQIATSDHRALVPLRAGVTGSATLPLQRDHNLLQFTLLPPALGGCGEDTSCCSTSSCDRPPGVRHEKLAAAFEKVDITLHHQP